MATSTIVVFGSGPGIGVSVAKLFAEEHFNRIVLCARDASHLDSEKSEVQNAAEKAGKDVKVIALPTDLANVHSLRNAFKAIEKLGPLGCVYHNAARIKPSEPLSTTIEEIEEDFKTGSLALYIIAQWAIPLLKSSGHPSPSFFVTNSAFPEQPMAMFLSLSMSKASQQNMMMSLDETFGKEIHFGVVKVCGQVARENAKLNPTHIAERAVALYEQGRGSWELMVEIRE